MGGLNQYPPIQTKRAGYARYYHVLLLTGSTLALIGQPGDDCRGSSALLPQIRPQCAILKNPAPKDADAAEPGSAPTTRQQ